MMFVFDPLVFASWFANVAWLVGIWSYMESRMDLSRLMAFAGVGLSSLVMSKPGLVIGYFVWVASMYLLLIGSLLQYLDSPIRSE
jgi:hypothetical protein